MNWGLTGKVLGNWVLLSLYLAGLWVITTWFAFPSLMSSKYYNYISAMTEVASQTPPYVWVGLSREQTMLVALVIDLVNIFAILTWPKLSGILALASLGNRQFFLRYNEENPALPSSPMCGYRSPHCGVMDMWHLGFAICGILVYNSENALPELTGKWIRSLGYHPPAWIQRWTSKLRAVAPEQIARPSGEAKGARVPSAAARKNI